MAAGGFKIFTTGEVLTSADTNNFLMQGLLVFANAAARDAAITAPEEGQACYLKDTDAVLTYSGSTWVGFDDSNAIQNAIINAKGDLIAGTANDTPGILSVGANDLLLTAASGEATGLTYSGGWTSFTPTLGGITLGNGSVSGKFNKIGKVMHTRVNITFGSTTAITGSVSIVMPGSGQPTVYTSTNILYTDFGVGFFVGNAAIFTDTAFLGAILTTGTYGGHAGISATAPMTWTTNDNISFDAIYEVA